MNKGYICFPGFKRKVLTLSYDDGVRQDKRLISIMQRYGLKGTFNINSGLVSDIYTGKEEGHMTMQEAKELYLSSGMEVAIHGHKHVSLSLVEKTSAIHEIIEDRKILEKEFGCIIKGLAYANGAYDDEVVDLLKLCGVNYARTINYTERFDIPNDWLRLSATCHHNNQRLMQFAKEFIEADTNVNNWRTPPIMFYLWGHSYEFDRDNNWSVIENFASYIGGREDIWYATNGEIFEYLQACERLEFGAETRYIKNLSAISVYVEMLGKKILVPAGKTVQIY